MPRAKSEDASTAVKVEDATSGNSCPQAGQDRALASMGSQSLLGATPSSTSRPDLADGDPFLHKPPTPCRRRPLASTAAQRNVRQPAAAAEQSNVTG